MTLLFLLPIFSSEDVKMPARGLPPILCCLLSMWTILAAVDSHPQHGGCQLVSCRFVSLVEMT